MKRNEKRIKRFLIFINGSASFSADRKNTHKEKVEKKKEQEAKLAVNRMTDFRFLCDVRS